MNAQGQIMTSKSKHGTFGLYTHCSDLILEFLIHLFMKLFLQLFIILLTFKIFNHLAEVFCLIFIIAFMITAQFQCSHEDMLLSVQVVLLLVFEPCHSPLHQKTTGFYDVFYLGNFPSVAKVTLIIERRIRGWSLSSSF